METQAKATLNTRKSEQQSYLVQDEHDKTDNKDSTQDA